jgi:glyoxylase-like metal-dependent hydrolase (beta-lactamase superfamily II)
MSAVWSWTLLRAGSFRLDGGGMFGVVPRTIWSKLAPPDQDNRISLQTNCLLLRQGSRRVLVETGFGDKWTEKERGYYDLERRTVADALDEAGCAAEQIDLVIVTHLHFDHAGGLTRAVPPGEPVPTFPAARIVVQRTEWEDALANKSTMTRTYLRSHLDPIADRLELIDGEQEIRPGLRVFPAPGHTWGQQAVRFDDGEGVVCFPGDVIPTVNHVHPSFCMGYDMLPFENMLTKKHLLARSAREGWRLALDHEPGNPVQRVLPDPRQHNRFRLEPVALASAQGGGRPQ